MLRFFREAQSAIYRDPKYVNELNTNEYDVEYEEDDEEQQEQGDKSKSNMMTLRMVHLKNTILPHLL